MIVAYKDYIIQVTDEPNFTLNSTDNIISYDIEYFDEISNSDRFYPTSKHGIRISKGGLELKSAIVCATGGSTTIHDHSLSIQDNRIFLCCCDTIYSLGIPELNIIWNKRIDPATCFSIYPFKNDFIIHGELQITRIDKEGNVKWNFGARDIFVTPDGQEAIEFIGDSTIKVRDWEGYEYILNENGEEIKIL